MSAEGCYVPQRRIARKLRDNFVAAAKRAQRQATAHRLCQHHQVRHDSEMLQGKEFPGASEPRQDLIEHEQCAATVAALAQRLDKISPWNPYSPLCLNRLYYHCGDVRIDRVKGRFVIVR